MGCVCSLYATYCKAWGNVGKLEEVLLQCLKTITQCSKEVYPSQTNQRVTYVFIIYVTFVLLVNVRESINPHSSETTPGNVVVKCSSTLLNQAHEIYAKKEPLFVWLCSLITLKLHLFSQISTCDSCSWSWHTFVSLAVDFLKLFLNFYICK